MTGTKILIIVLVLIVVLFVVLVGWGYGHNKQGDDKKKDPNDAVADHPGFLDGLNDLLGSRGPKIDAAHLDPSLATFDLQRISSYTIHVLPDKSHTIRRAKVKVQPPNACARVVFTPSKDAPEPLNQERKSDDKEVKNRNEFNLAVPKGGGTLLISRQSSLNTSPCTVTLE